MKVTADAAGARDQSRYDRPIPRPARREKWKDGVNGQISPTVAGDLNAHRRHDVERHDDAAAVRRSSARGASRISPRSTEWGSPRAAFRARRAPRRASPARRSTPRAADSPARTSTCVSDRAIASISGATHSSRFDPPSLQFTDPASRALGAHERRLPRQRRRRRRDHSPRAHLQRGRRRVARTRAIRRRSSTPTPTRCSAPASRRTPSRDSIAIATPLGVPLAGSDVPTDRQRRRSPGSDALDDTRDTLETRALTTYVGYTRDGALGFGPLVGAVRRRRATRAHARRAAHARRLRRDRATHAHRDAPRRERRAHGGRRRIARFPARTCSCARRRSTANARHHRRHARRRIVLADGRFAWTLEGGERDRVECRRAAASLQGDGSGGASTDCGRKAATTARHLHLQLHRRFRRGPPDELLAHAVAARCARARCGTPRRRSSHTVGADALLQHASTARASRRDGFASAPAEKPGARAGARRATGRAPSRLHVSPRVGFSYTYNRDKDNGTARARTRSADSIARQTGTIRGGIGEFRDLLRPGHSRRRVGGDRPAGRDVCRSRASARPFPARLVALRDDPGTIPTQCVDGSGVLAESAPSVTLIDPRYDVPRSWRASLDWNASVHRLACCASAALGVVRSVAARRRRRELRRRAAAHARERRQSSGVRVAGVDRSGERRGVGGRVAAVAISSDAWAMRVSDLRGYGGQLTFGLVARRVQVPRDAFVLRVAELHAPGDAPTVSAASTARRSAIRASVEWAPDRTTRAMSSCSPAVLDAARSERVTLFARAQSGLPFTPIVQGDVNGDGRGGDRAFIPNPARETRCGARRAASLAASRTDRPRREDCLVANLGRVGGAQRLSRAVDAVAQHAVASADAAAVGRSRVAPNVYLQNVLAGVDQLRARQQSLRGWGSPASPDPVLLVPRGFDASTQRFRYDVNPRFADTRPGRTLFRDPFRLVIDFSINLSTDYDLQQLRRAVEPVQERARAGSAASADSLAAFYLSNTSSIHKVLLAETRLAVPERVAGGGAAARRLGVLGARARICTSRSASSSRTGRAARGRRSSTACRRRRRRTGRSSGSSRRSPTRS